MGKPSPKTKSAAFVSGIALVFFIVSAWACVRLPYIWLTNNDSAGVHESAWIQVPDGVATTLFIIHLALAAFTLYASVAMYRLRPWTRLYFATVLLSIGVEGSVAAVWMALHQPTANEPAEIQTIRWVVSVAILLLCFCGMLLAWKLYRDDGIKQAFL